MTWSPRQLKFDTAYVVRFTAFGVVMGIANIIPYPFTRGAYGTDGIETAGWPLRCYEIGGFAGHWSSHPWAMAANITIAVMVSGLATWLFRDGILKSLQKWQTWGTPCAK